ncbi:hypothetical protein PMAYCL1PPCAC_08187, partial [Pristionchus mayeri]
MESISPRTLPSTRLSATPNATRNIASICASSPITRAIRLMMLLPMCSSATPVAIRSSYTVNGVVTKSPITCKPLIGWEDSGNTIVDFSQTDGHLIVSFCRDKPPPVVIPGDCDTSSFMEDCDDCTNPLNYVEPTAPSAPGTLTCPAGSTLVVSGSKVFDRVECLAGAGNGWKGYVGATPEDLIKFAPPSTTP